jgi:transcriptional regulator with XRE-family HTH domain
MTIFVDTNGLKLHQRMLLRRRELNLTQQQVAERAGITRNYVSQIERGSLGSVTLKTLFAYAEVLGWAMDIHLSSKEVVQDLVSGESVNKD